VSKRIRERKWGGGGGQLYTFQVSSPDRPLEPKEEKLCTVCGVVVVAVNRAYGAGYRRVIYRPSPPGKGAPDMGVVLDQASCFLLIGGGNLNLNRLSMDPRTIQASVTRAHSEMEEIGREIDEIRKRHTLIFDRIQKVHDNVILLNRLRIEVFPNRRGQRLSSDADSRSRRRPSSDAGGQHSVVKAPTRTWYRKPVSVTVLMECSYADV